MKVAADPGPSPIRAARPAAGARPAPAVTAEG